MLCPIGRILLAVYRSQIGKERRTNCLHTHTHTHVVILMLPVSVTSFCDVPSICRRFMLLCMPQELTVLSTLTQPTRTHLNICQCDWLHDPSFQTSFAQSRLQGISQFYDSTKNGHKPKRFISIKSVKVIRVCERAQCHHLLGWLRRLLKLGPPRSHQHPTIANFANWSMQSFRVLWHTDQQQVSQPVRQTAATSVDRFGHYATQQRPLTAN